MRSIDTSTMVIALLFGFPSGVGITLATLRVTGGSEPWFAGMVGIIAGGSLFLAILVLASTGEVDPPVEAR